MRRYSRRHCQHEPLPSLHSLAPSSITGHLKGSPWIIGSGWGPRQRHGVSDTGCSNLGFFFVLAPHVTVACLPPCSPAVLAHRGQRATALQWGSSPAGLPPDSMWQPAPRLGSPVLYLRGVVTGWPSPTARLGQSCQALAWLSGDPLLT